MNLTHIKTVTFKDMMNLLVPSLCLLLVEVHSQTEFPYVSFMGETLPNNSYVDISLVGDDVSGNDSVQCHTDLETCCSSNEGLYRGHWFTPYYEDRVPYNDSSPDMAYYEVYAAQRVDIRRRNGGEMPFGKYCCDVFTNGNQLVMQSVYVRILYQASEGQYNTINITIIIHYCVLTIIVLSIRVCHVYFLVT